MDRHRPAVFNTVDAHLAAKQEAYELAPGGAEIHGIIGIVPRGGLSLCGPIGGTIEEKQHCSRAGGSPF